MHTPAYSSSTSNSARSDPSSPSIRNSMKRERNFDHDVDESEISLLFLSHPSISASIDNTNANLMQAYDNSNGNLATAIANANGSSAIDAAVASAFLHKKTASSSTLLDGISTDVDHRYNSRSPKLPKTRSTHSQRKASEMSLSSIMARANMLDSPSSSSITNDQSIFNNNNGNNHGNGNTSSNSNGDDDGDDSFSDRGEEEDDASSPSNNQLWTLEEDQLLLQKQEEIGNKWAHIISYLPHRNQNQLKVRFKSILRASRREWTAQENNLLIQLHHESKADWSIIAPCFPHRTKNAVKKHHRFLVKMKKDNLYPLPPAHGAPNQIFYDKEGLHNKIRELANIMLPSPNKDEKPGTSPLLNTIEAVHLQGNNNNSNSSSSSNSNNASDSSMSRFNPSPVHLTHLPISDSKNFSTVKARNASPDSHHLLFQQQQQQQLQQQQQSEQQHQHQQQYVQHHHHHHQQQQQQHVQVQQPNWTPNVYNSQQQQQQQHVNVGMPVSNVSGAPFMGGLLHTDSHLDAGASGHMIVRSNPSPAVVTTTTGSTTTAPSTPANVAYQQQQQQQHTVASTSPFPFRSPLKARKNSKQAVVPASLKQDKLKTTPDGKKTIAQPGMHPSDQSHHVHHHQQYQQQQQQQTMYNNMPAQNLSMNNYQPNQYQQQIYQHQQQINQHQQQQYHQAMNQAPPPLPPQQQFFFPPIYQLPYPGHDGFDDLLNTVDFSLDDDDKTIFGNQ